MRNDVFKRIVYEVGFKNLKGILTGLLEKGMTNREIEDVIKERFGDDYNMEKLQIRSWMEHLEIVTPSYKRNNKHAVDVVVREIDGSLQGLLDNLYNGEMLSSHKIAEKLTETHGVRVTPNQVGTWMRKCGIEVRSLQTRTHMRWEDESKNLNAVIQENLEYGREVVLERLAAKESAGSFFGNTVDLSKLERLFVKDFLTKIEFDINSFKVQQVHRLQSGRAVVSDFTFGGKIIEVNGDYWHNHPYKYPDKWKTDDRLKRAMQRDEVKDEYYKTKGIEVLYVWEDDIHNNPPMVLDLVDKFLKGDELESNHSYHYSW